jgi:hypothetical protein
MLDNDDTTGRGTQSDHGDFTARILPISDARTCLEQAHPLPEWPDPDMSVLRPDF